jgi:hypothetical protein
MVEEIYRYWVLYELSAFVKIEEQTYSQGYYSSNKTSNENFPKQVHEIDTLSFGNNISVVKDRADNK